MSDQRKEERRKGDLRKDKRAARSYLGMERRLSERRRYDRRTAYSAATAATASA